MSYGNVLGALFWWLPTGRKDAGVGGEVTNMKKGKYMSN